MQVKLPRLLARELSALGGYMLKRFLVLGLLVSACWEAEPDSDTLGELRDTVASFPIEIKMSLARWAANRVALGYMLSYSSDHIVGRLVCIDLKDDGTETLVHEFEVTIRQVIKCLQDLQTQSYKGCLAHIRVDIEDQNSDKVGECTWETWSPGLDPEEMPHEFDAERIIQGDMTWTLIGLPPPPLEIQLMLLGLPGMTGPNGALCPRGVNWACADNPLDDAPGESAGSGYNGGDR